MNDKSLQEQLAPEGRCFGCGPANAKGLRIRSFASSDAPDTEVTAQWSPEAHHEAFEGVLNGGIIGALLDCHSNWTALWHLMCRDRLSETPFTVTADFHVKLKRPTPSDRPVRLWAQAMESDGNRVKVSATLTCDDIVTATCEGTFVAIDPDHPAFGRW